MRRQNIEVPYLAKGNWMKASNKGAKDEGLSSSTVILNVKPKFLGNLKLKTFAGFRYNHLNALNPNKQPFFSRTFFPNTAHIRFNLSNPKTPLLLRSECHELQGLQQWLQAQRGHATCQAS